MQKVEQPVEEVPPPVEVEQPVEEAPPIVVMEAETSEEIDSISDEALVSRSDLEMELEWNVVPHEAPSSPEPSPASPEPSPPAMQQVVEEPMDQQVVVPVHSAPDFTPLEHLGTDQPEPIDEKCEQMVVETQECAAVNLEDMLEQLKAKAGKDQKPLSDEEQDRARKMAEINMILEQTYTAIDLCDHRLVDGFDLRDEDFARDVEENIEVINFVYTIMHRLDSVDNCHRDVVFPQVLVSFVTLYKYKVNN